MLTGVEPSDFREPSRSRSGAASFLMALPARDRDAKALHAKIGELEMIFCPALGQAGPSRPKAMINR
jgi:hypothetical protein